MAVSLITRVLPGVLSAEGRAVRGSWERVLVNLAANAQIQPPRILDAILDDGDVCHFARVTRPPGTAPPACVGPSLGVNLAVPGRSRLAGR